MTAREAAAADGLRVLAGLAEHLAREIDGPGAWGELAANLTRSAARHRRAADHFALDSPSRGRARLRAIAGGAA